MNGWNVRKACFGYVAEHRDHLDVSGHGLTPEAAKADFYERVYWRAYASV